MTITVEEDHSTGNKYVIARAESLQSTVGRANSLHYEVTLGRIKCEVGLSPEADVAEIAKALTGLFHRMGESVATQDDPLGLRGVSDVQLDNIAAYAKPQMQDVSPLMAITAFRQVPSREIIIQGEVY